MSVRPDSTASDAVRQALNTPLLNESGTLNLDAPRATYFSEGTAGTTPQGSALSLNNAGTGTLLPPVNKSEPDEFAEERTRGGQGGSGSRKRRGLMYALVGLAVFVVVVLAVILPVYFTVIKPKQNHVNAAAGGSSGGSTGGGSSGGGGGGTGTGSGTGGNSNTLAITGGDGSKITADDGTSFTYNNKFGGYWVYDVNDPFNNGARPNSWTPALNETWTWGQDHVYGVNLGGLFVLEPFISPALFQKYPGTVDEWTLSQAMAADTASGGLNQLEDHYNTFITEQDIAQIAGAGLNWIRLPIPFWAIETWPGEPFLAKTSWKYILRVLGWARKYGLRVNLDLHTIPGSQNGYNHSGKWGQVDFLNGVMGFANAQRALNYIRIITEFISQPEYKDVVPMFGIVNEALVKTIGTDQITSFYLQAHDMMRAITGVGAGNGPYMSIHDGFNGVSSWAGFLPGSDRIILDTHPYFAFDGQPNREPIATGTGSGAGGVWPLRACNAWGPSINTSRSAFGVTVGGEFSNGYNDCGLFLRGVNGNSQYGDCTDWNDYQTWNASTKAGVQAFAMASMDAIQDFFFWTWKIGNSSTSNSVQAPLWSYQLGLENGWIPADPRTANGTCASLDSQSSPFDGEYESWQTGGAGAGTIAATATASFGQWPPATISNAPGPASLLPSYTSTGTVVTLPPPTFTASMTKSVDVGDGWFNTGDTAAAPTAIAGCTYPDAWDALTVAVPAQCGSGADAAATTAPVRRRSISRPSRSNQ